MAQIIRFPLKVNPRDEALRRLAVKLAAHLTGVFYERQILDIPVQAYVTDMLDVLMSSDLDYEPNVLEQMGDDPEILDRFTTTLISYMVEYGHIPADKA